MNKSKQEIIQSITNEDSKQAFLSQAEKKTPYLNTHRNILGRFSLFNVAKNLKDGVSWNSTTSMRRLFREARDQHNMTNDELVNTLNLN